MSLSIERIEFNRLEKDEGHTYMANTLNKQKNGYVDLKMY